jgi:hypothetical protein
MVRYTRATIGILLLLHPFELLVRTSICPHNILMSTYMPPCWDKAIYWMAQLLHQVEYWTIYNYEVCIQGYS